MRVVMVRVIGMERIVVVEVEIEIDRIFSRDLLLVMQRSEVALAAMTNREREREKEGKAAVKCED